MTFKMLSNSEILIADKVITFPCSIQSTQTKGEERKYFIVEFSNLIIVNFYPFTKEEDDKLNKECIDMERNIWAFNQDGVIVWKIQAAPRIGSNNTYTGLGIEDGKLKAYNWNGCYYFINPQDGSVTIEKGGRPW